MIQKPVKSKTGSAYKPRSSLRGGSKKFRVNGEIRATEVMLISPEGEKLGVFPLAEALRQAGKAGLDLVEFLSPSLTPVCRILDYGKFVFETNKKKAVQKKKQVRIQLKEVKLTPRIEEADYQVKLRNVISFLKAGHKVKITLRFKGREIAHVHLGIAQIDRLEKDIVAYGTFDDRPKMEGKQIVVVVSTKKAK